MKRYNEESLVVIDGLPKCVRKYEEDYAIICVDVIRATTTAITAVAKGRRCFPVGSLEKALSLSVALQAERPILVGELGGNKPAGFGLNNSPAELDVRDDVDRPIILLSSSGTQLIFGAMQGLAAFLACFRNFTAAAESLVGRYRKIAVIGAGSGDEFREEDQICCAWVADILVKAGYKPATKRTRDLISRWRHAKPEACLVSKSADFLKNTGQERDLDFILSHIDDLNASFMMADNEVIMIPHTRHAEQYALETVQ
ncbi:MAG TPA: 2-phosphosulfolactate phosphatase [Bacteroidota bacterium]|nr:2-phosphosulfolactate phosphatase [Bacteroidota bacterium]